MQKVKSFFKKHPRADVLIFLLLIGLASLPYTYNRTASLTLSWNQDGQEDFAGYRVFYGNEKSVHLINVKANQTKSSNIPDLKVGETYYFAISAYDTNDRPNGSDAKLILNVLKEKNGHKKPRKHL